MSVARLARPASQFRSLELVLGAFLVGTMTLWSSPPAFCFRTAAWPWI